MTTLDDMESADSHGYFVPMIDMLAGVIFILIIMLAAVSLVSRDDFQKASVMQKEISKITAQLDAARKLDATYLEPRRIARAALLLLLQRLQGDLAAQGITAQIFPDDGRLLVPAEGMFDGSGAALSAVGSKTAAALAGAMATEVPCLARGVSVAGACGAYNHAHLDEATIVLAGPANDGRDGEVDARALMVLSAIGGTRPALLVQKAVDGRKLLDYQAAQSVPAETAPAPAVVTPASPASGTPAPVPQPPAMASSAKLPTTAARPPLPAASSLELVFKMNVPPIPLK